MEEISNVGLCRRCANASSSVGLVLAIIGTGVVAAIVFPPVVEAVGVVGVGVTVLGVVFFAAGGDVKTGGFFFAIRSQKLALHAVFLPRNTEIRFVAFPIALVVSRCKLRLLIY